jgi:hypothetical protein
MPNSVRITLSVLVFVGYCYKDAVKPAIQGKEENTFMKAPGILELEG